MFRLTLAPTATTPADDHRRREDASLTAGVISTGSWVAIFGTDLAPSGDSRTWDAATEIVNGVLPLSLDGTLSNLNGNQHGGIIQPTTGEYPAPDDTAADRFRSS